MAFGLSGVLFLLSALRSEATDRTWTGSSGVDNNWMTAGNWQGGVAPVAGDNLIFNGVSNAGNSTNHNNYPSGTMFGKITIATASDQDFSLGGNRVVLTNGLAESAGGIGIAALAGFVYFDVTLGADQTFTATHALYLKSTVDLNGHYLTLNNSGSVTVTGMLSNSVNNDYYLFALTKTNSGTLTIPSGGVLAVNTLVKQGPMRLDGTATNDTPGSLSIYDFGTTISGTGTADTLVPSYSPGALVPGVVSPGDNAPGIMRCETAAFSGDGGFTAEAGTFQVIINGTTPGSNYSQLVVFNDYVLSLWPYEDLYDAATLDVQMGYTPQIGDSFLVLQQTSGAPYDPTVNGNFFGLTQNGIYDLTNGYSLSVIYDTNGVTLTTIRGPASPFVLWKGSVTPTGDFGSRNWSLTNNWAQGLGPGPGSHLEFTSHQYLPYAAVPPVTNDLTAGASVASLLFTDTNYALYGNALTVTEGITNQTTSGTLACHLDLVTTGPLTLEMDTGGTLLLDQSFNGSGTVRKEGGGTLLYTGMTMNSFVGSVIVDSGTLQVDGSFTDGSFTVNGGLLDGTGTVSSVTLNGGTLKPGDSPGIFHIQGDLNMAAGAVFEAELDGPIPGTSYDQLQVNGGVNLNGATLNLQPGYAAGPGAAFLILVNDGTDPIVGTFAGLPEGAVFQAGGQYFSISYKAGSGNNDVVVTRVNPPANFKGITLLNAGTAQLQGIGTSNVTYTIQANTNLATTNWVNIGTAPADSSGFFFFNDTNVLSFPLRFFRVLTP